jgi:hypothetical protein
VCHVKVIKLIRLFVVVTFCSETIERKISNYSSSAFSAQIIISVKIQ